MSRRSPIRFPKCIFNNRRSPSFLGLHPAVLDHLPLLLQILLLLGLLDRPDLRQLPIHDHSAHLVALLCAPTPSDPPADHLKHEEPEQDAASVFVADIKGTASFVFDDQAASELMYHSAKSPTMSP